MRLGLALTSLLGMGRPSFLLWGCPFPLTVGVGNAISGSGGWPFLLGAVFGPSFLWLGLAFPPPGGNWPFLLAVRGSPLLLGVGVGSSWSWPSGLVFGPSF